MVLLTSSQVSIAISSGIVVLFTAALFLSGYAIQQRTLRDLRKAIRPDPRPSPKIYLPDRFKQSTTELPDGTVVDINDKQVSDRDDAQRNTAGFTIEVKPSTPGKTAQKPIAANNKQERQSKTKDTERKKAASKKTNQKEEVEDEPMSRAERRRRIKEEIRELSQGETPLYYQRRLW